MHRLLKIFIISLVLFSIYIFTSRSRAQHPLVSSYYLHKGELPVSDLYERALDFSKVGQMDSALLYYSLVANRYYENRLVKSEAPTVIDAFSAMGNLYHFVFYDFRQAYNCLTLAEKLSLEHNYQQQLPSIYLNLAGIAFTDADVHQYPDYTAEAIKLYKKSYRAALEQHQYEIAVKSYINLINFATDDKAKSKITDEIESFEHLQDNGGPLYQYALMLTYGTMAQINKDYATAIDYYKQMAQLIPDSISSALRYRLVSITRISDTYFKSGDEEMGLTYLHELEQAANVDSIIDLQVDTYRELESYYRNHGNKALAQRYHLLHLETKDAMMEKHNLESVKYSQFLNQLDDANEYIREISYQRQMQNRILISLSLLAIVLLVLVVVFIYHNRVLQSKNKSIYRQMVRLLEAEQKLQSIEKASPGSLIDNVMQRPNEGQTTEDSEATSRYKSSTLTEEEKECIFQKIQEAMQNVDLFCNDSFSLQVLSDYIQERPRLVSQVINERYNGTFPAFVNEYRIREACRRIMNQEQYGHLSLAGIGESVGFKSRSQFSLIFKKVVGMTAAEYQKESRK